MKLTEIRIASAGTKVPTYKHRKKGNRVKIELTEDATEVTVNKGTADESRSLVLVGKLLEFEKGEFRMSGQDEEPEVEIGDVVNVWVKPTDAQLGNLLAATEAAGSDELVAGDIVDDEVVELRDVGKVSKLMVHAYVVTKGSGGVDVGDI